MNDPDTSIPDLNLGRRLASYQVVQRIGEGGMGVVYRAHHLESGEVIAIKLIKRGMDTQSVLRRFHNERRILESLRHPNIARILDAGATPEGLPYFVMEYITGQPINIYCDLNKLSVEKRLRLFQKVCAAVECAHRARVVHRDIKPENILVSPEGEPKLLDFGIAKVLDVGGPTQDATATLLPVMTPHYASPEQSRGLPASPSSDIYSLGVLLYELLAGSSPYCVTATSPAAFLHAIWNDTPRRPSSAIAEMQETDPRAITIAASRSASPKDLQRSLAGDLDVIVLTALDKVPSCRYRTVGDFSEDINRYLGGSRLNARKLKHRFARLRSVSPGAVLAALGVLVLVVLIGLVYYQSHQERRLKVRPSVAVLGFQNLSNQASDGWLSPALTEMLSTELAAGAKLRTVPGELVARVKLEMGLKDAETLTKDTLGRLRDNLTADYVVLGAYLAVGQGQNQRVRLDVRLQNTASGELVASSSETRSSLELISLVTNAGSELRAHLGAGSQAQSEASVRGSVPDVAEAARKYAEGLQRLRTFDPLGARELLRNAVIDSPGHALTHAALSSAASMLGYEVEAREEARKALDLSATLGREDRLSIEGRFFETTRVWEKAVATYKTLFSAYPDNLDYGLQLAAAHRMAGEPRKALDIIRSLRALPSASRDPRVDLAEAESLLAASDLRLARDAAQRAAQAGASRGMRILAARGNLIASRIALESGDPQSSLAAAAQAQQWYLAAGYRQGVAWALNESAAVLTQRGDIAGARARYEEALNICRTIGDQTCIGTDLDSIGVLRRRQGDLNGALEMYKQAHETRRVVGDRTGAATSLYNIGNVLEIIGDLSRAHQAAGESLEIRQQLGERRSAALTMSRLGNILRREGNLALGLRMNEEAVNALRTIGDRGGVAMAQLNLALALFDQGDLPQCRSVIDEALAVRRQQRDRNNIAQAAASLALVALAEDRLSEAAALVGESISLRQELGEKIALAESYVIQSAILLEQGNAGLAEKAAHQAATTFHDAGAWGPEGEALLSVAAVQLALGDAANALANVDAADKVLAASKDAQLRLRGTITRARTFQALGRKNEAATILTQTLAESRRLGLPGLAFEVLLASLESNPTAARQLAPSAQQAGFLRIARKAR